MPLTIRTPASVALCALACTCCIGFHGPEDLRRDLARSAGVELDRETGVTVGRLGLAVARMVTDDDDVPLRGLRKVEIGVYDVVGETAGSPGRIPLEQPELPGWQTVVSVREDGQEAFVLVERREDTIRRLLVIVAEDDAWVLVRLRGRLDGMLEQAMRMAFERVERPELVRPALADYRARRPEAGG